jgi:hypothetical protein
VEEREREGWGKKGSVALDMKSGTEGSWKPKKGRFGWYSRSAKIKFQINVDDNNMHKYVPIKL